MDALVDHQAGALPEAFATGGTGVQPRTLVAAMVAQQRGALAEAAPTVATRVGLLTCVRALVAHQRGTLQESLAALGAFKGFLPQCVCRCRVSVELLPKFVPHTPRVRFWSAWLPEAESPGLWAKCMRAWFHSPALLHKARGQCVQQSELVLVPLGCACAL